MKLQANSGYIYSILQYSKPLDLKKEINDYFRDTHPSIDPFLTLSQIRNLKIRMLQVAKAQDIEYSSLAMAFVYVEKLILCVGPHSNAEFYQKGKQALDGCCLYPISCQGQ